MVLHEEQMRPLPRWVFHGSGGANLMPISLGLCYHGKISAFFASVYILEQITNEIGMYSCVDKDS